MAGNAVKLDFHSLSIIFAADATRATASEVFEKVNGFSIAPPPLARF